MTTLDSNLITATSVRAYFHEAFAAAKRNQDVDVGDTTSAYVINLLTAYAHIATLQAVSDDGKHHKALATIYAEAVAADNPAQRNQGLQRLGDVALFIAGIFTDSLNRKLVGVNYYIAMGETAHGSLHEAMQQRRDPFARSDLFDELGRKFGSLVDVLSEVSEASGLKSNGDILRTYESWLSSGSERARKQLARFGIIPLTGHTPALTH